MSRVKRQMDEDDSRGFRATGTFVCAVCIGDRVLGEVVAGHAEAQLCSYCARLPSASLDTVLAHMLEAIRLEYRPASEESPPWESAEGGYQAPTVSFPELLFDEMDDDVGDEGVRDDIEAALLPYDEAWFERDWYALRRHQQLIYSWRRFATVVQRRPRPVLRPPAPLSEDPDVWAEPDKVLEVIAEEIAKLPPAIREFPAGARLWRGRAGVHKHSAAGLGPPSPGIRVPGGRMNQEGQIFFYGALDRDTAVREVAHKPGTTLVTVGPFELATETTFLDLSGANLTLPSIFDLSAQVGRATVRFLQEFAHDISLPSADTHPRGYFPTQMVTEYVRTELGRHLGVAIDGILYPSARASGSNVVMFFGEEVCADLGSPPTVGVRLLLDAGGVVEVPT